MATQTDLERVFYGAYLGYTDAVIATKSLSQLRADFVANGPLSTTNLNTSYSRLASSNIHTAGTNQFNGAVGINGNAPQTKAAAVVSPTAPSAAYVQAEATSAKTAIDAIVLALKNIGITL